MRIKHRAKVSSEFTDTIASLAQERAQDLAKTLTLRSESTLYRRNIYRGMHPSTIYWVRDLARGGQTNDALDQELARLYTSKYKQFGVQEYNDIVYFWGETLDVVMEVAGVRHRRRRRRYSQYGHGYAPGTKFDIGSYFVYVPRDAFMAQTYSGVHWIPARKTMSTNRHPHHTATVLNSNIRHPLNMSPYTCSGGFSTIFAVNLANMEVAGMFRSCYIFLARYNTGSPLTEPDKDFMKLIEESDETNT